MVRSYCCQYLFADFRRWSDAWSDMHVLVARPMLKILKFASHVCCMFIVPFVPSISDATSWLYSALSPLQTRLIRPEGSSIYVGSFVYFVRKEQRLRTYHVECRMGTLISRGI